MKSLNKFKGFTLVEVLIVIIIVGILIAALLPRLTGSQARARDAARAAGVNQLAQGIALLLNDAGTLSPAGTEVCVNDFDTVTGAVNGTTADLSDYLASIPTDPQANHDNGGASALGSTACNGFYIAVIDSAGEGALVMADLEGTQNANIADAASTDDTVAEFQTLMQTTTDTDANFGVVVR